MNTKEQEVAVNPEEEFKKLREKSDEEEMAELKRGLLGGYNAREVAAYVGRLKGQLQTSERTFKGHIVEINAEKDQLRYERDALVAKLAQLEATPDSALKTELQQARRAAEGFLADKGTLEEKLQETLRLADENIVELKGRIEAQDAEFLEAQERFSALQAENETIRANDLETMQAERNAFQSEKNALQENMYALQSEMNALQENMYALQSEKNALQENLNALQSEKNALQENLNALQSEKNALQEDMNALQSEQNALQENMSALQSEKNALQEDMNALQSEKNALQEDLNALQSEKNAWQENLNALQSAKNALQSEKDSLQSEKESMTAEYESAIGVLLDREAVLRNEIGTLSSSLEAEKAVSEDSLAKCAEAQRHAEGLSRENAALSSQLEVARQNILQLISDKQALESINDQLRSALNSLVVKADALIKENNIINSLLTAERDRVQQYQAMNDKLSDMLMRVRTANQLLDEKVVDMDKALSWGSGQLSKANPTHKRGAKTDMLDFSDGKSTSLQDIIGELNALQANLAQYQLPNKTADEKDKKPNIRYSVEKLELDCPPGKPDFSQDEYRLPAATEFGLKMR